jgi:predicted Rossmann fold nucleotide-binding protein DprA/Smf involved in DNA uptake
VVEGAPGSGAKITVDHGHDVGIETLAVPGSPASPLASLPLELIHDGATMVRGAADALEALRLPTPGIAPSASPDGDAQEAAAGGGSPAERAVFEALGALSTPDEVAAHAGVSLPEAIGALVRLELRGLVRSAGGRFERTVGSLP